MNSTVKEPEAKKVKLVEIKMLSSIAGNRYDKAGRVIGHFTVADGKPYTCPEDEAARIVAKGYAEYPDSK